MIQLILFLIVGALLFFSLYFLARRSSSPDTGTEALLAARTALTTLRVGLLPPEVIGRILATEDLNYVNSEGLVPVRALFLDERKKIALLWVKQVRRQIASLSDFHRYSARFYGQLRPGTEMMLAAEFAALLLACRVVQGVLYMAGPYAVPNVIQKTAAAASRICAVSEKSLGFLSPVRRGVSQ